MPLTPPSRFLPQSTIARFALAAFMAIGGSMAILLGFLARSAQSQLDADARVLINAERAAIERAFDRGGFESARAVVAAEIRVGGPMALRLDQPGGTQAVGNIELWPEDLAMDGKLRRITVLRTGDRSPEPFAATATRLNGGYRLFVGRSLAEQERLTAPLTTSLVAATGLALLLAIAFSALLARIASGRIQAIADVAGAVAAGDLSRRIPVPVGPPRDAFDSLGIVLNTMLGRIEALLDELRALTDGLAHDLRSPITRMKVRIDRLQRSGDASESQLVAIGAEADALLAMLENSLAISRAEAGIGRDDFEQIDLAALATAMTDMYGPIAEDSGVQLSINAPLPVPVQANRALLGRALANLIDNALRYAGTAGVIDVGVTNEPAGARLTVADRGPGIPAANRETALRRFGRLDAARSSSGAGLGLSLAAAITRLHGGQLALQDNEPGLRVEITIPAP